MLLSEKFIRYYITVEICMGAVAALAAIIFLIVVLYKRKRGD